MSDKGEYTQEQFNNHYNACSPLRFNNLSPMKSGKRFLNPSFGGNVTLPLAEELSFSLNDVQETTINGVTIASPYGRFTVTGQKKWTEYSKK